MQYSRSAAHAVCLLLLVSHLDTGFAQDTTAAAHPVDDPESEIELTDSRVHALKERYQKQVMELTAQLIVDIEKLGTIESPPHLQFVKKNDGKLAFSGSLRGFANHSIRVNSRDIEQTQSWHHLLDNPPLPARSAITIADDAMRKWFDGEATSFVLQRLSLVPLSPHDGKWYWEAQYEVSQGTSQKELTVAIRMDRHILTKLKSEQPHK